MKRGFQGKHRFVVHDLENECVIGRYTTDEYQRMCFVLDLVKNDKDSCPLCGNKTQERKLK